MNRRYDQTVSYACRASPPAQSEADVDLQEALFASKVDAFAQEYNHLLVSQLDSQRQYFEGLLRSREAQSRKEAQKESAEARAEADECLSRLKREEVEVKQHMHAQKVAEKRLVSTQHPVHMCNSICPRITGFPPL